MKRLLFGWGTSMWRSVTYFEGKFYLVGKGGKTQEVDQHKYNGMVLHSLLDNIRNARELVDKMRMAKRKEFAIVQY